MRLSSGLAPDDGGTARGRQPCPPVRAEGCWHTRRRVPPVESPDVGLRAVRAHLLGERARRRSASRDSRRIRRRAAEPRRRCNAAPSGRRWECEQFALPPGARVRRPCPPCPVGAGRAGRRPACNLVRALWRHGRSPPRSSGAPSAGGRPARASGSSRRRRRRARERLLGQAWRPRVWRIRRHRRILTRWLSGSCSRRTSTSSERVFGACSTRRTSSRSFPCAATSPRCSIRSTPSGPTSSSPTSACRRGIPTRASRPRHACGRRAPMSASSCSASTPSRATCSHSSREAARAVPTC